MKYKNAFSGGGLIDGLRMDRHVLIHALLVVIVAVFVVLMESHIKDLTSLQAETIKQLHEKTERNMEYTIKSVGELQERTRDLEVTIEPHQRMKELERWQRHFCTSTKLDACALLKPID